MNTKVVGSDWVGRIVDHKFPLLEMIGSTEESCVFRTELQGPQLQKAAIKLIAGDAKNAATSLTSWELATGVSHPHLLRVFNFGRCQVAGVDLLYVVMELYEEALSQIIPERALTSTETGEMLEPVLGALTYLHGKDLVHGRLRPSNIVVVQDQVKLKADVLSRTGTVKPPPSSLSRDIYNAPEAANGTISPATDIWSLGITLVESLTRRKPVVYSTENADALVQEALPAPFGEIAKECLRADPARRATASQVGALLRPGPARPEPASEMDAVVPSEVSEPVGRGDRATVSKPRPMVIAGVAAVLVAIIVFALSRSHKTTPVNNVQNPPTATDSQPSVSPAGSAPQKPLRPQATANNGSTSKGEVVKRVLPDVSESAMRTIRGKIDIRVRVEVDAGGTVSNATLDSKRASRYFTSRALDAARGWKFRPAQKGGEAVASEWILRFQLRRSGIEADPVEVRP